MTIGTYMPRSCVSSITTPVLAHALMELPTVSTYTFVTGSTSWTSASSFTYLAYEVLTTLALTPSPGVFEDTVTVVANLTTITSGLAVADPIQVAWQLKDLSSFPASYATSIADRIGVSMTPTVSNTPTLPRETGASPTPQATGTTKLSTSAKAGIGIGSVIGVLAITATVILLWLRARRKATPAPVNNGHAVPEMEDQDKSLAKRKWFLGGRWRSEAQAEGLTQELDSRTVHIVPGPPAELETHAVRPSGSNMPVLSPARTSD
jgi:hypothetical protein